MRLNELDIILTSQCKCVSHSLLITWVCTSLTVMFSLLIIVSHTTTSSSNSTGHVNFSIHHSFAWIVFVSVCPSIFIFQSICTLPSYCQLIASTSQITLISHWNSSFHICVSICQLSTVSSFIVACSFTVKSFVVIVSHTFKFSWIVNDSLIIQSK